MIKINLLLVRLQCADAIALNLNQMAWKGDITGDNYKI